MKKPPKLTKKILRDDLALSDAISAVLEGAKRHRAQTKKILLLQRTLQRKVARDAWNVYLHLEDAVNERSSDEQDRLVRWAFRQGRRYERRRS
jgi:hypothetical protein